MNMFAPVWTLWCMCICCRLVYVCVNIIENNVKSLLYVFVTQCWVLFGRYEGACLIGGVWSPLWTCLNICEPVLTFVNKFEPLWNWRTWNPCVNLFEPMWTHMWKLVQYILFVWILYFSVMILHLCYLLWFWFFRKKQKWIALSIIPKGPFNIMKMTIWMSLFLLKNQI